MTRRLAGAARRARRVLVGEGRALAALLAVGALFFAFIRIADEVIEGDTHAFDRALLLSLRRPDDLTTNVGPTWLAIVARDITALGGFPVLMFVSIGVLGFLGIARRWGTALLVVIAVGGGTVLSLALKHWFMRGRPDLVPHEVVVSTSSFPSQHAMLSAVVYLTLGALLARVAPQPGVKLYILSFAAILSGMIGASRVFLGVHWPTDVVAGWCVGAAWALACWLASGWLQRRRVIENDRATPEEDSSQRSGE